MGRTYRFVGQLAFFFLYKTLLQCSISIFFFNFYYSVGHDEFCQMKKTDDKIIDKIQTQ